MVSGMERGTLSKEIISHRGHLIDKRINIIINVKLCKKKFKRITIIETIERNFFGSVGGPSSEKRDTNNKSKIKEEITNGSEKSHFQFCLSSLFCFSHCFPFE